MKKNLPLISAHVFMKSLFFVLLITACNSLRAQSSVTGTVFDKNKNPVDAATISIKGTRKATTTNAAGKFSIEALPNDLLEVSHIGFATIEVPVNSRRSIEVNMINTNGRELDAVIVTALGIKRETRKLGYSATSVKTEELVTNRTNNVGESLEGRVAGLNITPPAAGAGSSMQIRLRGQVGFSGSTNSPLIVVDGLPLDQGVRNAEGAGQQRDQGDNLQVVNPDDIESMTVLKGSTASALYGSRAVSGAIIMVALII